MKRNIKKINVAIGTLIASVIPVSITVSCGSSDSSVFKKNYDLKIESSRILPPSQDGWSYYKNDKHDVINPFANGFTLKWRFEYTLKKNDDNPTNVFYVLTPKKLEIINVEEFISGIENALQTANIYNRWGEKPYNYAEESESSRIYYIKNLLEAKNFLIDKAKNNDVQNTPVQWTMEDGKSYEDLISQIVGDYVNAHPINPHANDLDREIQRYNEKYNSDEFTIQKLPDFWGSITSIQTDTWVEKPRKIEKFSSISEVDEAIKNLESWKMTANRFNLENSVGLVASNRSVIKSGQTIYSDDKTIRSLVVDKNSDWYAVSRDGVIIKNGISVESTTSLFSELAISANGDRFTSKSGGNTGVLFKNSQEIYRDTQIDDIAVDKNGNWFVATAQGVVKNAQNIFSYQGAAIMKISIDASGNWFAVTGDNAVIKNGQKIFNSTSSVTSLAVDKNGNWFIGTSDGKVFKNGQQVLNTMNYIHALSTDVDGNWYTGDGAGNAYKNGNLSLKLQNEISDISINEWGSRSGNW